MLKVGLLLFVATILLSLGAFAQTPTINSDAVDTGTYGAPYIYNVTATGGAGPVKFTLVSGAPGLGLTDNGDGTATLSGTPSSAGSFPVSIKVEDQFIPIFNSTQDFTLEIGKAPLTITPDPKTKVYGDVLPPLTFTYSGLTNGDVTISSPPTISANADQTSHADSYTISLSDGSDDNYDVTLLSNTLTITPAALTITADNQTRAYGAPNPELTVVYSGFVNGDTFDKPGVFSSPLVVTSADAGAPVTTTYAITPSGAVANDYNITFVNGTLTVTKATLTATADDQSRAYGAPNPDFTISYSGFVNNEDVSYISKPSADATGVTVNSHVDTYEIKVSNGSATNYDIVRVSGTLTITKAILTVTILPATRDYKAPDPSFTISYSGFLNGDNLTAITSFPAAAPESDINSGVGTYNVNLTGGVAHDYSFSFVTGTLTITKATPVITWATPAAITYPTALSSTQLNATSPVAGSFVYSPANGVVPGADTHQLTAVFTPTDVNNYNVVTNISVNITINKATPVITWANPANITYGTLLSSTQLNATADVAGSFVYDPDVNRKLNAGSQILKADFHPADAVNYNDVLNIQRPITVDKATPTYTWPGPDPIVYGTPLSPTQLNVQFSVPGTITYISDPGTILPAGERTLYANFAPADPANYNSVIGASTTITVLKADPTVSWPTPADIVYGTPLTLGAQLNVQHTLPGVVVYSKPDGTILSAGLGQVLTATFTPTDDGNYNSVTGISTTINVLKANPVITWANPSAIVYGTALSATQLNATSNKPGSFAYMPRIGDIPTAGTQTLSVTFTPADPLNYNVVTTTRTITVNKAVPVVTWPNPAQISYGTALDEVQLNATASVPGVFQYTPGKDAVLFPGANQLLSVKFTPADLTNYQVVNATSHINVVKATPVITWSPLPTKVGVALNTTSNLNAVADVPGTFTYSPAAGSTFASEGMYTLHADFTPTDQANYNKVFNISAQITVNNKENPVITWSNPANITYGTLLSNATGGQLVAQSNVAGTYVYDPIPGTRLNAGFTQPLKVTFIPNDGDDYNTITKTVSINVLRATLTATASNTSRPYGAANPNFNITYTGFVGTDNESVIDTKPSATSQAIVSDVAGSTFDITPAGGTDNNYRFTYVTGTLTITQVTLTVTANNQSRTYGAPDPSLTLSYSGFVNGQTAADIDHLPTATTVATPTSAVGSYNINASNGLDVNYSFVYTPGTLTITKASLTAAADNKITTYGTIPDLTITYTGLANGEDASVLDTRPNATTSASETSEIGIYDILLSAGNDNNYNITTVNAKLTINKATLNATADNKSRIIGFANPALTITYSGFVNGETADVLDVTPAASTIANINSSPGDYTINVSGGSDDHYNFFYHPGTLTVVFDSPPVVKNFSIETNEDSPFALPLSLFKANYTDDVNGKIVYVKITALPQNGSLFKSSDIKVVAGEELPVTDDQLSELYYLPDPNYNGTDAFSWNVFDGAFIGANSANVSITVKPVNDPPVLSNIEASTIVYAPGDPEVQLTSQMIISDIDDNYVFSASVSIVSNFTRGDVLNILDVFDFTTNINLAYDATKGVLSLTGKDTRDNYETVLRLVTFSSPVNGDAVVSDKTINIIARDSTADSNIASRTIGISQIFPDLDLVNAFTPNGDGVNDEWDILNMEYYSQINVAIFNTDGLKVFECNDRDCKWDGTYKGKPQAPGTYFYTIDLNNGRRTYRGSVTILK